MITDIVICRQRKNSAYRPKDSNYSFWLGYQALPEYITAHIQQQKTPAETEKLTPKF